MVNEWATASIDELKAPTPNAIAMGPFGSRIRTENFVSDGVPVIRGNNLNDERLHDDDFVYLTKEKADELRASNASKLDIVITHRGTLGQVGIIPRNARYQRYVVSQSQLKITIDQKKADPYFVFYYLRSPEGQHQLLANTSTTGVPAIARPTRAVKDIIIPYPPINEQRAISSILCNLDDKIEINRQMNETLESIIKSLFKSWFVDFDYVHAKAEDRDTGLTRGVADIFPDGFEDLGTGEIPKGWRVGTFGDVARNQRRSVKPGEIETSTPYIALEHMPKSCIALDNWGHAEGIASNKYKFNKNEILFGKLRPYFHKVGIAPIDGVCSTDILVISPVKQCWTGFVLGHASSTELVEHTSAGSTGTKMPRTSWNELAKYPVVLPPENVAKVFDELILPLIDHIIANIHYSRTITEIRDTLLPKLTSGELRVQNIECFKGGTS